MSDKELLIDLALKVATVDSAVLEDLRRQVAKCQNVDTSDDPPFEYLWKYTQQIANAAMTIQNAVKDLQHCVGVRPILAEGRKIEPHDEPKGAGLTVPYRRA